MVPWSNSDLWASQRPESSSIPPVRWCVLLWHCNHGGYIAVPILYLPAKTRRRHPNSVKRSKDQGRRALEELIDLEAGGEVATPVPVLVTDGLCAFSVDHSRLRAPPARPSAELCQPDLHRWLIPHWPPHSLPTGRSESRADELQPRPWAATIASIALARRRRPALLQAGSGASQIDLMEARDRRASVTSNLRSP